MNEQELEFYRIFIELKSVDTVLPFHLINPVLLETLEFNDKDTYLEAWHKFLNNEKDLHPDDYLKWMNSLTLRKLYDEGYLEDYPDLPRNKITIQVEQEAIELGKEIRKLLDKLYNDLEAVGDENLYFGYEIANEANYIQMAFFQTYSVKTAKTSNKEMLKQSEHEEENMAICMKFEQDFFNLLQDFSSNSKTFKTFYEGGMITNTSEIKELKKDINGNNLPDATEREQKFKDKMKSHYLRKYRILRYMEIDIYDVTTGQSNNDIFDLICYGAGRKTKKYNNENELNKLLKVF